MNPEQRIKDLAIARGAEVVGIASVEEIDRYAPPGHRPGDFLAGAKSVVVIGGRPIGRSAWRSPDYTANPVNSEFPKIRSAISGALARFIEDEYGYYALPQIPPAVGLNASLSLKLCGELAGLGRRSMAGGVILNPKIGFINFWACITDMPLQADGRAESGVCPHPACQTMFARTGKTPCLRACPECLSGELDGDRIKWMKYNRRICSTRAQTLSEGSLQALLREAVEEDDPAVRRNLLFGSFSRRILQGVSYGVVFAQCIECLRYCPVVVSTRRVRPRGDNEKGGPDVGTD